jgi:hypothetical protein
VRDGIRLPRGLNQVQNDDGEANLYPMTKVTVNKDTIPVSEILRSTLRMTTTTTLRMMKDSNATSIGDSSRYEQKDDNDNKRTKQ